MLGIFAAILKECDSWYQELTHNYSIANGNKQLVRVEWINLEDTTIFQLEVCRHQKFIEMVSYCKPCNIKFILSAIANVMKMDVQNMYEYFCVFFSAVYFYFCRTNLDSKLSLVLLTGKKNCVA